MGLLKRVLHPPRCTAWLVGLALLLVWPGQPRADHQHTPAMLKAAFLRNFIEFTQWPNPPPQLLVCSYGQENWGEALGSLDGYRLQRSVLTIRQGVTLTSVADCHIIFVPHNEKQKLDAILNSVRGLPVLVVADFAGGAQLGATLSLHYTAGRMAFDANLGAAQAAKLLLRSRLLQLAQRVY